MTVPAALRNPYFRRFELRRHRLSVAGGTLSLVAPQDMNSTITPENCRQAERDYPYWAAIWPASVAMGRYLLRGPRLEGEVAMDLGCGIGVAGVAAGVAGARPIFVDRSADALRFAQFNADHNGVVDAKRIETDWFIDAPAERCDLLLLSDVSYDEKNHQPLMLYVRRCLADGGRVLHADPERAEAGRFLDVVSREFPVEVFTVDTHFVDRRSLVRLAIITRGDGTE